MFHVLKLVAPFYAKIQLLQRRAATNRYFGGQNVCNSLLYLTAKHLFENFGGRNCPVAPPPVAGVL